MNRLFRSQDRLSRSGLLVAVVVLLLATYLLTPRFWEQGTETWKQWAAARILRETGGFPVFSLGPAYVVYLQFFQLFDFPLSAQLEYVVTHLFSYIAIFLMLRSVLPGIFALLLTCAWIPAIAIVEPGGAVAGMGFIALYFRSNRRSLFNRGYFPLSLLAAALCHSAYLLFLIGNIIGVLIERRVTKQPILTSFHSIRQAQILPLMLKAGLLMLVILTILFPSRRWDHNHMLMDPKYVPIPLRDPLSMAFFQVGNWKYVMKTVPKSLWIYQDWYFTNEKAFGGATTILQAVLNKPDTVVTNILENMRPLARTSLRFIIGNSGKRLAEVFSLVLLPIGLVGVVRRFKDNGLTPLIFSIIFGTVATGGGLLLTWVSWRYFMVLLPVGLLIVACTGPGLWWLVKSLLERIARRYPRPVEILRRFEYKGPLYTSAIVVLVSAILVLFTAYPCGKTAQIKAVLGNRVLFSREHPYSIVTTYPELLSSVNEETSVLALEDIWIKAFARVDLDRVYNAYSLPPFSDPSGKTDRMLNNTDVIWVSSLWSGEETFVATQGSLRYRLHVAPFLEKALARGWTVQEVEGYGKIYRRPSSQ